MSQRAASAFWQRSKKAGFDGISRREADDERDQDSYFPHRQGVRRAGAAVRREHYSALKASGVLDRKSKRLWLPVSAYLIECAHGNVLFDCGWHAI